MTIAILAHDSRKELALQFCTAYSGILSRNTVIATGTTGRMLAQATGLPVHCYLSGRLLIRLVLCPFKAPYLRVGIFFQI